jgi:aryl-alcohol dehydrogenase-like predicted oxidoreductase
MKYRKLGKTNLEISEIGLGTFQFDSEVWGPISEKKATEILVEAYENGINYFNSAFYYGKGRCEEILGRAVKKMDRDRVIVATKVGTEFGEFSLSEKRIKKSTESILKRMQLEYIDILILHHPDLETSLEETINTALKIRDKGLIKHIGLSNFPIDLAGKAVKLAPLVVFEFYFSLLTQREGKKVLEFCKKHNISSTPFKVIERGILTDKFLADDKDILKINRVYDNPYTGKENLTMTKKLVRQLQELAQKKGITLAQLAISWALHQRVTCALVGIRSIKYLKEDLESVNVNLSNSDLVRIDKILKQYGAQT